MSIYAIGDLHGRYDLYQQVCNFLKPEDKVIFLGDAADRGPDGWKTLKAIAANPQWMHLMGNHEHMLAGALAEYLDDSRMNIVKRAYRPGLSLFSLALHNGAAETIDGWHADGEKADWINYLLHLPADYTYENKYGFIISCSHAGYTPGKRSKDPFSLVWDREHIKDRWPEGYDKTIIVHGHTPILYEKTDWMPNDGAYWYADNHKVDIDAGAYATNVAILFDLDTLDEHLFTVEKS